MHHRLCSESVLLIRREDVLRRLTPDCCLSDLSGATWKDLDVEGEEADGAIAATEFSPPMFSLLHSY